MGSRRVILLAPAQRDLDGIRAWRRTARKEATRLLSEVLACLRALRTPPDVGTDWGDGLRSSLVRSYRVTYRVVYQVTPRAVLVLGMADTRAAAQLARIAQRRED